MGTPPRRLELLFLVLLAGTAAADKRITDMTPGFQREAATCATQVSGLEKVQAGIQAAAPGDKDLETLAAGLAEVKAYCTEVTDLVAFLQASAAASYKSVEKELDERDNKVRRLRKQSKATIDGLAPLTRTWIQKLAQRAADPTPPPKAPAKFPSGRALDLPAFGGTWKVSGSATTDTAEYTDPDKWGAKLSVRAFSGATCAQQWKAQVMTGKPTGSAIEDSPAFTVAWMAKTSAKDATRSYSEVWCTEPRSGSGGWMASLEIWPAGDTKLTELRALVVRMVAAQAAPKQP